MSAREDDALGDVAALQWAYSALVVVTKDERLRERWNLDREWFRRAMPTIGRMLEDAIARDREGGP